MSESVNGSIDQSERSEAELYDGEHPKTTLSVSTGVKIVNFMRVKMKNYIRQIIVINHNKYFIAKFAFK